MESWSSFTISYVVIVLISISSSHLKSILRSASIKHMWFCFVNYIFSTMFSFNLISTQVCNLHGNFQCLLHPTDWNFKFLVLSTLILLHAILNFSFSLQLTAPLLIFSFASVVTWIWMRNSTLQNSRVSSSFCISIYSKMLSITTGCFFSLS